jgi:hypothetical protein
MKLSLCTHLILSQSPSARLQANAAACFSSGVERS